MINTKRPEAFTPDPILFNWQDRWLKGHEYAFILNNIEAYCTEFGFVKFEYKTHPVSIY
jgi:hypothetical protein